MCSVDAIKCHFPTIRDKIVLHKAHTHARIHTQNNNIYLVCHYYKIFAGKLEITDFTVCESELSKSRFYSLDKHILIITTIALLFN